MADNINVVIHDEYGKALRRAGGLISVQSARSFNTVGSLTMRVSDRDYPIDFWRKNMRIKVYYSTDNGPFHLVGNTVWFVKSFRWLYSESAWEVVAKDTLSIVDGPLVGYPQDTTYADKTAENGNNDKADNLMRAYVSENMGAATVDVNRNQSAYLDVEDPLSLGAPTEKTAGYQELFSTLTALTEASAEGGINLVMDVVPIAEERFIFRVFKEYLGSDRATGTGIVAFSPSLNNITDVELAWDYSSEVTMVFVGGVGEGAGRFIYEKFDFNRINRSPFNLIERFIDKSDDDDAAVLDAEAKTFLQKNTPKLTISARTVDIPGLKFGKDFFYGDRVLVAVGNYSVQCVVNAFTLNFADGKAEIEVRLRGEVEL